MEDVDNAGVVEFVVRLKQGDQDGIRTALRGPTFGMSPAFVGFIIAAPAGVTAELAVAFSAARKNCLDMSVSIALGSAAQIALFVASG